MTEKEEGRKASELQKQNKKGIALLALRNEVQERQKPLKKGNPPAPVCPRKCWVLAPELHSQQATVLSKEPVTSFCSSNFTAAQVWVWMPYTHCPVLTSHSFADKSSDPSREKQTDE